MRFDMSIEGGVGINTNYLSHPSNSIISSGLAIRFTEDVVILRNRATDAPVHPNFRPVSLVLVWPQFTPHLIKPCSLHRGCRDVSKYLPLTFDNVRSLLHGVRGLLLSLPHVKFYVSFYFSLPQRTQYP